LGFPLKIINKNLLAPRNFYFDFILEKIFAWNSIFWTLFLNKWVTCSLINLGIFLLILFSDFLFLYCNYCSYYNNSFGFILYLTFITRSIIITIYNNYLYQ
jgi:hypothetical protein